MLLALRSLWEPAVTPTPTLPNAPGRVIKGKYPYWKPRKPRKPFKLPEYAQPLAPVDYRASDEVELLILAAIDLD